MATVLEKLTALGEEGRTRAIGVCNFNLPMDAPRRRRDRRPNRCRAVGISSFSRSVLNARLPAQAPNPNDGLCAAKTRRASLVVVGLGPGSECPIGPSAISGHERHEDTVPKVEVTKVNWIEKTRHLNISVRFRAGELMETTANTVTAPQQIMPTSQANDRTTGILSQ
jgi:hypothetical protein